MQILKPFIFFLFSLLAVSCDPHGNKNYDEHCNGGGCRIDMGEIVIIADPDNPCDGVWTNTPKCMERDDRETLPPEDNKADRQDPPPPTDPVAELPEYNPDKDRAKLPKWDFGDLSFDDLEDAADYLWGEITGANASKRRKAKRIKKIIGEMEGVVDQIDGHVEELDEVVVAISGNYNAVYTWNHENRPDVFNDLVTTSASDYNNSMDQAYGSVPDTSMSYGELPDGSAASYPEQREVVRSQKYINTARQEIEDKYAGDPSYSGRSNLLNAAESAIETADAHYRQGNREEGDIATKIALALTDAAIGLTPGLSLASDVYTAITGENVLTGEKVSDFEYWTAVAGVLTGGVGSSALKVGKALIGVGKAMDAGSEAVKNARKIERMSKLQDMMKMKSPENLEMISRSLRSDPNPNWVHPNGVKGGKYGKVRGEPGNEAHHMPAKSVSPLSEYNGPAISMSSADHRKTASYGPDSDAAAYREAQKQLIKDGKFREAINMDINDIRSNFSDKYDQEINDMLKYVNSLGL